MTPTKMRRRVRAELRRYHRAAPTKGKRNGQLHEVDSAIQRVASVIGPVFGVGDVVGFPEIVHLLSLLVQLMIPRLASDGKSFEGKSRKQVQWRGFCGILTNVKLSAANRGITTN